MRRFAQDPVQVGAERDLLVSQLRIGAVRRRAGIDNALLLFGHLQAVRLGVLAVPHQAGDRQHRADHDLLVVLARIRSAIVVAEHRQGGFRGVLLLEIVKSIAHFPQRLLGFLWLPGKEPSHRQVECQHVAVAAERRQLFFQLRGGSHHVARVVRLASASNPICVGRAARRGQGHDQQPQNPGEWSGSMRRIDATAGSSKSDMRGDFRGALLGKPAVVPPQPYRLVRARPLGNRMSTIAAHPRSGAVCPQRTPPRVFCVLSSASNRRASEKTAAHSRLQQTS